jgi:predicted negative regulator of RcsB-dependent stress response
MDRCAINFIARHWWRRVEVWVIAILLVAGGSVLGFQAAQWSLASWYGAQVVDVRRGYDEALKQRDLRLNSLADKTQEAAGKVEAASISATQAASTATQAADTASKAADKVNEAVDRQGP